jgi:cysteinyl-tRNA synthetase
MNAIRLIDSLKTSESTTSNIELLKQNVYAAMNDDFNTPVALAHLFEAVRIINSVNDGKETLSEADKQTLKKLMHEMVFDILGLREEQAINTDKIDGLMQMILEQRKDAKARKDFASSDLIRDKLKDLGFEIKDGKDGTTYSIV